MEEQIVSSVPAQEMNWLSRIFNVFFEPRKVFESLKRKPKWLMPFMVCSLITIGIAYYVYPIAVLDQVSRIEASDKYSDAQKEAMRDAAITTSTGPMRFTVLFAPVGLIIGFLIVSAVLFFVFNILMGGDSTFKTVLSVYSHSYVILILGGIIKLPLMLLKKTVDVPTSLALILSPDQNGSFLYSFLNGFDAFAIWQILIMSFGLSIMYNFSFKKSFIPILIMWIILILISALLAGLFAGFGGM